MRASKLFADIREVLASSGVSTTIRGVMETQLVEGAGLEVVDGTLAQRFSTGGLQPRGGSGNFFDLVPA